MYNSTGTIEEIIFVKYIKNGNVQSRFLTLEPPETANGVGLKHAVEHGFQSVVLDDWKLRVTSKGTDGACVNTGREQGLVTLLR